MIKFEKVTVDQFMKDFRSVNKGVIASDETLKDMYSKIKLPERATDKSAGYDFFMPYNLDVGYGTSIIIPTGIRCFLENDQVLLLMPRSGQGFKYRLMLVNTIGVIDADYVEADNQGHIMVKIIYNGLSSNTTVGEVSRTIINGKEIFIPTFSNRVFTHEERPRLVIEAGKGFCQGIITNYYITDEDFENIDKTRVGHRTGGFGSTDN
jgi:dUTP pyrophosphatase